MGQKVHPHGIRVGIIKNWSSRWFVKDKDFGDTLVEDHKIREFLKKQLFVAGIPKIEIERDANRVRIFIYCAKPGVVIGRNGAEIERLKDVCQNMIGKPVVLNIVEVKQPDLNAQLVAEGIAAQLEKRVSFRRALKQAIGRTMKLGAKGIKTQVSGRLGGAEIARSEHYHEGTIPLQTFRADIDYGFAEANTTYGKIGVKIWIYTGEVLKSAKNAVPAPKREPAPGRDRPRGDRPPRRDGDRPPRRDGDRPPRKDGDKPFQKRAPRKTSAPKKEGGES